MDALLDLIFAPICLGCDGAIASADPVRLVCGRCRTRLRPIPPPACERCGAPLQWTGRRAGATCQECDAWPAWLRAVRSAVVLHPPADRLVHQLKYRGWRALAEPMAERMAALRLPADVDEEADFVVPVPTTRTRLRERGYNQAELLARAFARRTRREIRPLLERRAGTGTQTTLQPASRAANVAGAFEVEPTTATGIALAHVVLIDDVLTTGATALECAGALVNAGARCVTVVTFARALDARRVLAT